MFGLPDYVRYIEVVFHTLYCNFDQAAENIFCYVEHFLN